MKPNGGELVAKEFVARLPDAQLEVIPEAGHAPWIDELDLSRSALGHFSVTPAAVAVLGPTQRHSQRRVWVGTSRGSRDGSRPTTDGRSKEMATNSLDTTGMDTPPVVSPEQWQSARDALLRKEKAATRARDELAAERRGFRGSRSRRITGS